MKRMLLIFLPWWLFPCTVCFSQCQIGGIQPGTSTSDDVTRVFGQPLRQTSATVSQYSPKPGTAKNVEDIQVEYRSGSAIVQRIGMQFAERVARAGLAQQLHLPEQADAKNVHEGKLVEYFGTPSFVSLTYATTEESSGVVNLDCNSRELFAAVVGPLQPSLNAGHSHGAATIQPDGDFTVRLLSPINTQTSKKGDKVTAQVLQPPAFAQDILEGQIRESKSGGKINGKSVLNFSFETLNHGGQAVPVQAVVKSVANSKGQPNVDEEGQIVKKKNNLGKIAAGTAIGALIGGLAGGGKGAAIGAGVGVGASIVLVEVAAEGANVSFAPGSEFVLSVKSQARR
jgi:hypothetical protein